MVGQDWSDFLEEIGVLRRGCLGLGLLVWPGRIHRHWLDRYLPLSVSRLLEDL